MKCLNDMINNKKLKVFVHCSSGISRAPTVVLAYLCLFKRVPEWSNIIKTSKYFKEHYHVAFPNKYIV